MVAHLQLRLTIGAVQSDVHSLFARGMRNSIRDKVQNYLLDAAGVAVEYEGRVRDLQMDRHRFIQQLGRLDGARHDLVEAEALALDRKLPALEPSHIHEVADKTGQ